MNCQSQFSEEKKINRKNLMKLSSTEFAQRVVKLIIYFDLLNLQQG